MATVTGKKKGPGQNGLAAARSDASRWAAWLVTCVELLLRGAPRALRILLFAVMLSLGHASAEEAPEQACLRIVDLPEGARVEVDGVPVAFDGDCILLEPGTYLVTIFPATAPPFEDFLNVGPGESARMRYLPPEPPLTIPLADRARRRAEPILGPALVGTSIVTGITGALFWLMADESGQAATIIAARDDLDESSRRAILNEIRVRESRRRDLATGSAALTAAFLVAGGVSWALAESKGSEAVSILPHGGGFSVRVALP